LPKLFTIAGNDHERPPICSRRHRLRKRLAKALTRASICFYKAIFDLAASVEGLHLPVVG
jgi:hypothetical protein